MADAETTTMKLRTTPTGGVAGEHSAYYRRLLSAGYKGYIQGSIGGGSLYGVIGLGIGAVVGLAFSIPTAGASLWLIPALGVSFGLYGAHTFADIGKTAAIIADSADTNEKRRYLLDRYYDTPNEKEAQEIRRQLEAQNQNVPDEKFHWRPAIVGALIGIVLAVAAVALMSQGIAPHFLLEGFEVLMHGLGIHFVAGQALGAAALPALATLGVAGAAIGGLAGSLIGIPREYIRRWLDKAEFTVHDVHTSEKDLARREQDIAKIEEAARSDASPQLQSSRADGDAIARVKEQPQDDRPSPKISDAVKYERMIALQQSQAH